MLELPPGVVEADYARAPVGEQDRPLRRAAAEFEYVHAGDLAFALEHERERRRRGDELDQLAEERLLVVLGVVLLGERAVDRQQPAGAHAQPAGLEAAEDLSGETALDGVRLDQDECALDS